MLECIGAIKTWPYFYFLIFSHFIDTRSKYISAFKMQPFLTKPLILIHDCVTDAHNETAQDAGFQSQLYSCTLLSFLISIQLHICTSFLKITIE